MVVTITVRGEALQVSDGVGTGASKHGVTLKEASAGSGASR